jgi:hypothetical protein
MRHKFVTEIDLLQIAKEQSFGPVKAGANLMEIGGFLGAPQYWGFSDVDKIFISYMDFGDVEIGFQTRKNIARVSYAKFYMQSFKRGLIKFAKTGYDTETCIRNSFQQKKPLYPVVEKRMRNEGIEFSTEVKAITPEETYAIMHFGHNLKFFFDRPDKDFVLEKSRLWFVEIIAHKEDLHK